MTYAQKAHRPVAKKVEGHYRNRAQQFIDPNSQYSGLNLPHYLDRARTNSEDNVKLRVYSVPDIQRPKFDDMLDMAKGNWKPAHIGDNFGPSWSTHWFHVHLKVPTDWYDSDEPIFFDFDSSDEGMFYTEKGVAIQGLSGEHRRTEVLLESGLLPAKDDWISFYIETSCNNISGTGTPPDPNRTFRLNRADLVLPRTVARALKLDCQVLLDCYDNLGNDWWQKHRALDLLNQICNTFNDRNVDETCAQARKIASYFLGDLDKASLPRRPGGCGEGVVYAIGNCHIDTAWLWPYAETRRKIARSWASQLRILDTYPDFIFAASQAVQFEWLKEDHPELFERVREAVKGGRFIPIGGTWVECDTNMPTGESLARQMVLGQRLFEDEFGERSQVFWLPDTFGYAPQLPQVCRLAQQPYFVTQKLSWNNIDVFPLSTFSWIGLDDSQVLCHMPPDNTYTAEATFGDVRRTISQHKNLDTTADAMMLFGFGDGGGGPLPNMMESNLRCRGISDRTGALPPTVIGTDYTPNKFFENILSKTDNGKNLPTWKGELYLEYHRGTYTTQASIKRGNRKSEALMFELEYFATIASIQNRKYSYPFEEISSLWKKICLNQFHDVLPGSGIGMIYEDANKIYDEVFEEGDKLVKIALGALGYKTSEYGPNSSLAVIDPANISNEYFSNLATSKQFEKTPESVETMLGIVALNEDQESQSKDQYQANEQNVELRNDRFVVKFEDGRLVSLFDLNQNKEILAAGQVGNKLMLFEDQPMNFPAWDTEQYSTEKYDEFKPTNWKQVDEKAIDVSYAFGNSTMEQRISLHDNYVNFDSSVEWDETYRFLKAEFPVDVINDEATYEAAFGIQKRPTHFNTSWDAAKFEVCGHRFADLSDYRQGVMLMNDCKYGYSIHGNVMRLSLLRSPKNPDDHADIGHHEFKYALVPHEGPLSPNVIRTAHQYNASARFIEHMRRGTKPKEQFYKSFGLFHMSGDDTVMFSSVKRGEYDVKNKKCTVVARLYETMGSRATICFNPEFDVSKVYVSDLLESKESLQEIKRNDNGDYCFDFTPFEVKTIVFAC